MAQARAGARARTGSRKTTSHSSAATAQRKVARTSRTRHRAKPGTRGGGRFYRIELRPKTEFITFRYHDVGKRGRLERIAGQRPNGRWLTAGWLIGKDMAHIENGWLKPDTPEAAMVIGRLNSKPRHVAGDRFKAKPRPARRRRARKRR
jgi:hypothetical protein